MAHKRSVQDNNRIEQAVQLRARGCTYDEIARQCGYSGRQSAQKAVQNELKRRVSANVDEMRAMQQYILNEIWRRLWDRLETKKGMVNLHVVDRLLKVLDQEAKLWGLYAPRARRDQPQGYVKVIIREAKEVSYETWLKGEQERKGP